MKSSDRFFAPRTIVALLLALWAAIGLMVVWSLAVGPVNPTDSALRMISAVPIATAIYSYPAILFGLPAMYLFWKNGVESWQWYLLVGLIIGLLYALILALGGLLSFPTSTRELTEFSWFALCGMASSALFRSIYRPNRKHG
jgi:hypothetical protein